MSPSKLKQNIIEAPNKVEAILVDQIMNVNKNKTLKGYYNKI